MKVSPIDVIDKIESSDIQYYLEQDEINYVLDLIREDIIRVD